LSRCSYLLLTSALPLCLETFLRPRPGSVIRHLHLLYIWLIVMLYMDEALCCFDAPPLLHLTVFRAFQRSRCSHLLTFFVLLSVPAFLSLVCRLDGWQRATPSRWVFYCIRRCCACAAYLSCELRLPRLCFHVLVYRSKVGCRLSTKPSTQTHMSALLGFRRLCCGGASPQGHV
jgi:hypothetical protein